MGPNVVLGAGLCSHGSNSTSGLPAEAGCSSSSSAGCSGSSHTAAAVAAVGPHARQLPALGGHGPSGGRSDEQQAYTRGKQQLALLNRYPSAPDPGPLLALSPVRSVGSKSTGMPPLALPPTDKQSVVRGAWLKVRDSGLNHCCTGVSYTAVQRCESNKRCTEVDQQHETLIEKWVIKVVPCGL